MEMSSRNERTLTTLDHIRLVRLIRGCAERLVPEPGCPIDSLLDTAELVASHAIAPDIVTMHSMVELADLANGARSRVTLCDPADAEPDDGFVSVRSGVGASLIGRRVGSIVHWCMPDGEHRGAEVVALLFQPESSGDYTT